MSLINVLLNSKSFPLIHSESFPIIYNKLRHNRSTRIGPAAVFISVQSSSEWLLGGVFVTDTLNELLLTSNSLCLRTQFRDQFSKPQLYASILLCYINQRKTLCNSIKQSGYKAKTHLKLGGESLAEIPQHVRDAAIVFIQCICWHLSREHREECLK